MSIVPAPVDVLEAFQRGPDEFATLIASPVPAGWPEFPEGFEYTIDKLRERPDQAGWWLHLFFSPTGRLVGSGGFVGPPDDGVAEIGYEIAPEFRGNGYATSAARELIAKARSEGRVHTVIAHTLANASASTSVLRKAGFRFTGEVPDEEEGAVWRWELQLDTRQFAPIAHVIGAELRYQRLANSGFEVTIHRPRTNNTAVQVCGGRVAPGRDRGSLA